MHAIPEKNFADLDFDFLGQSPALERDPAQSQAQERGEVAFARGNFAERCEVGFLLVVVKIGHRNEGDVFQACSLEKQSLQASGRSAMAIQEWMHRRELIVDRQRANQRIMIPKGAVRSLTKLLDRLQALRAALHTAMPRNPEGY